MATVPARRLVSHYPAPRRSPGETSAVEAARLTARFDSHLRAGRQVLGFSRCTVFDRPVFHLATKRGPSISPNRFAWERSVGPIPDGMLVIARCKTPRCVDPEHHYLATPSQVSELVSRRPPASAAGT